MSCNWNEQTFLLFTSLNRRASLDLDIVSSHSVAHQAVLASACPKLSAGNNHIMIGRFSINI